MNERGAQVLDRPGPAVSISDPLGRLGRGPLHRGPMPRGAMWAGGRRVPERLLSGLDELAYAGDLPLPPIAGGAFEGGFWNESLGPDSAMVADEGAVTPTTTLKALWAPVNVGMAGALRANFWRPGRRVRLTAYVKLVVGATPGNILFSMCYGSATAPDASSGSASSPA